MHGYAGGMPARYTNGRVHLSDPSASTRPILSTPAAHTHAGRPTVLVSEDFEAGPTAHDPVGELPHLAFGGGGRRRARGAAPIRVASARASKSPESRSPAISL